MSPHDETDDLRALADLGREVEPPSGVEERVVAALRDRSLIRSPTRSPRPGGREGPRPWRIAAAVLLAALGGWVARGLVPSSATPAERGREYLVLFAEPRPLATTKSTAVLVDEYREWGAGLAERGHLVTGRRLLADSRRLSTEDGSVEVEPADPLAEATGFLLIRATSWSEALDLVSDAPHLGYGGEISLREVARDG